MKLFFTGVVLLIFALVSTSAIFGGAALFAAASCFACAYYVLQGGAQ